MTRTKHFFKYGGIKGVWETDKTGRIKSLHYYRPESEPDHNVRKLIEEGVIVEDEWMLEREKKAILRQVEKYRERFDSPTYKMAARPMFKAPVIPERLDYPDRVAKSTPHHQTFIHILKWNGKNYFWCGNDDAWAYSLNEVQLPTLDLEVAATTVVDFFAQAQELTSAQREELIEQTKQNVKGRIGGGRNYLDLDRIQEVLHRVAARPAAIETFRLNEAEVVNVEKAITYLEQLMDLPQEKWTLEQHFDPFLMACTLDRLVDCDHEVAGMDGLIDIASLPEKKKYYIYLLKYNLKCPRPHPDLTKEEASMVESCFVFLQYLHSTTTGGTISFP